MKSVLPWLHSLISHANNKIFLVEFFNCDSVCKIDHNWRWVEILCSFLSLFSCLFSLFSFMFHECSVSNITIYVTYVLIRTFVGTNLNPLWEKFLVPSEGKDCMELNYQLHKRILCFFFKKKKKKGKKSDLYCLQRVASSHPY